MKLLHFLILSFSLLTANDCFAKPGFSGGSSGGGFKPSSGGGFKPSGGSTYKPSFGGGGSTTAKPGKPSFGGGSNSTPAKAPTSVSKKPVADSFDKLSGTEARKIESRKSYTKSTTPKETYKTPTGHEAKVDNKQSEYLRGRLDESHWQTRYQRSDSFYGSYSSHPGIMYNDCYHPMWNYWLMSQSLDIMSMWVYCHQMNMDQARLANLYAQNAGLQAQVQNLQARNVVRDPNYTPPNVDSDLQYNDNYVDAVYNPVAKTVDEHEETNWHEFWKWCRWLFVYPILIIAAGCLVFYLVFVEKW